MFVKLLAFLFSNVFVSFSVLLCCRSLASKWSLKGGNEQRKNWSLLVRSSAQSQRSSATVIECTEPAIKRTYIQAYGANI
jgi:hypothetical protein